MDSSRRLQALRKLLAPQKLDFLLVTHLPNVRYLSGFTGSSAVLIVGGRENVLFTDGRYTRQAREEARAARVVIVRENALIAAGDGWRRSGDARPRWESKGSI